jgi:hypothetical protein
MEHESAQTVSDRLVAHIKDLYHAYRHTEDLGHKGLFFSPDCLQICRPTPSYAATTREEIVQYLKDAQQGKVPVDIPTSPPTESLATSAPALGHSPKGRGVYTIRPLRPSEMEFGTENVTRPIGMTPDEVKQKAQEEGWSGMRVNLWDEGGEGGLLVRVQYWWRLEKVSDEELMANDQQGKSWRQCLHDIMYLGPKYGTEIAEGLEILE